MVCASGTKAFIFRFGASSRDQNARRLPWFSLRLKPAPDNVYPPFCATVLILAMVKLIAASILLSFNGSPVSAGV
ncbi:hypothetical protein KCP73_11665 [Salmonella enterica subsp. enterica]|nr:hypothetical protein KCP73_11665 [Salmonella enterica subsp. enterica]